MESCCCKMTLSTCQSSDSTFDDDSNETDSLSQGTSKTTLQTYDNCSDDSCYCWSLFLFESHKKRGISAYNNPKLSDFLCFWSNETIDVENIDNNFLKSILVRLSQNMAEKRLSFVHEIYPKLEIPTEIVDEIVSFELGPGVSKVENRFRDWVRIEKGKLFTIPYCLGWIEMICLLFLFSIQMLINIDEKYRFLWNVNLFAKLITYYIPLFLFCVALFHLCGCVFVYFISISRAKRLKLLKYAMMKYSIDYDYGNIKKIKDGDVPEPSIVLPNDNRNDNQDINSGNESDHSDSDSGFDTLFDHDSNIEMDEMNEVDDFDNERDNKQESYDMLTYHPWEAFISLQRWMNLTCIVETDNFIRQPSLIIFILHKYVSLAVISGHWLAMNHLINNKNNMIEYQCFRFNSNYSYRLLLYLFLIWFSLWYWNSVLIENMSYKQSLRHVLRRLSIVLFIFFVILLCITLITLIIHASDFSWLSNVVNVIDNTRDRVTLALIFVFSCIIIARQHYRLVDNNNATAKYHYWATQAIVSILIGIALNFFICQVIQNVLLLELTVQSLSFVFMLLGFYQTYISSQILWCRALTATNGIDRQSFVNQFMRGTKWIWKFYCVAWLGQIAHIYESNE